jgi:hypothetical protein
MPTVREIRIVRVPLEQDVERFVLGVCAHAGIRVQRFPDGTLGLVDVPAKYVAAIDALHCALISVVRGDMLPELAPVRTRRRR